MKRASKDPYHKYVENPRFGHGPRFTGLNPGAFDAGVSLISCAISNDEWREQRKKLPHEFIDFERFLNSRDLATHRVAKTAILANPSKQDQKSYSRATHYFDLDKTCVDCKRPFLFFAEEQRYWFEELGFPLCARCLRCFDCRKQVRDIELLRKEYERLLHIEPRNQAQNLAMADICLALIEAGTFTATKTAQVRALLNTISKQLCKPRLPKIDLERASLLDRVLAIEAGANESRKSQLSNVKLNH